MAPPSINYLDCVQCFEDGKICLGSSSLTGSCWDGSLWCFENVEDAPDIKKCVTGIGTEFGIADILCLSNKRVAVAFDSGTVVLYSLEEEDPVFFGCMSTAYEHYDVVASLSVNSDETRLVSGSYDKSIKVWDIESWSSVSSYQPAHAGLVNQVAFSTCDPETFLSCSQDGKIILWDLRLQKPGRILSTSKLGNFPTSVSWQPNSSTIYSAGDCSGRVTVNDIRGSDTVQEHQTHRRSIYRVGFCPTNPQWIASCAFDTILKVVDISKQKSTTIYVNDAHEDFIRGMVWAPDGSLLTCGWDKQVLKHDVNLGDAEVTSPIGN